MHLFTAAREDREVVGRDNKYLTLDLISPRMFRKINVRVRTVIHVQRMHDILRTRGNDYGDARGCGLRRERKGSRTCRRSL